jgi:hypothetical protein
MFGRFSFNFASGYRNVTTGRTRLAPIGRAKQEKQHTSSFMFVMARLALQRLQAVNSPFGTLALFRPVKAGIISGFTGSRASWPFAPFLKCKRRPDEFSVVNQWVTVKTARAERVKSVLVAERGSGFL